MKLAIGSVQFGVDYGAFNSSGQVSVAEVHRILRRASESGISLIDTARDYGTAEEVLGSAGAADQFRIVTKCPSLKNQISPEVVLRQSFEDSCSALGVDRIYGYMLHDANDLNGPHSERIWNEMESLRTEGRVVRIGVSTYGIEEAQVLCKNFPLSLVQVPGNVLAPWYDEVRMPNSVEVHVRSVFLQGFLLSDPAALSRAFRPWRKTLDTFRARANDLRLTPLQSAIIPLLRSPKVDRVVVGVDRIAQLDEIVAAVKLEESLGEISLGSFPEVTTALTDPRKWKRG